MIANDQNDNAEGHNHHGEHKHHEDHSNLHKIQRYHSFMSLLCLVMTYCLGMFYFGYCLTYLGSFKFEDIMVIFSIEM